jgi:hypothetical protein
MANSWAFPALWAGLTIIAKLFAMGFEALTALSGIVAGAVARLFRGVISDISGLQSAGQWNQPPGSTEITRQLNDKIRRCAIADRDLVMSCIFGVIGFLQPAA